MSAIRYAVDEELVIPIPAEALDVSERESWAARAAARFGRLSAEASDRLRHALAREQATLSSSAGDADTGHGGFSAGFVAFDPVTSSFASTRLAVASVPFSPEQRRAFLLPEAPLPPQLRVGPTNSFGDSCSSTFPRAAHGGTAEIRWLWVAEDATLVASAAPIRLAATLGVGSVAEAVLRSVIVDGADARRQAEDFDPAELIALSQKEQPAWRE
ncbi:hypothetical protein [Microbacterium radiodurans]|uniref:Uncharacterized protein n=1 Tax=Microbacterium radiodurans TaxID=661398 RepID=A0A5J5ISR4_9MICO|nr:hypothetical protein [Microbacterium radiodurans]KAA9089043.1 hypothetical protein F6B42_00605 [Microbacterium radiodurans]